MAEEPLRSFSKEGSQSRRGVLSGAELLRSSAGGGKGGGGRSARRTDDKASTLAFWEVPEMSPVLQCIQKIHLRARGLQT